jgi:antirestriction protein ArdC
MPEKPGKNREQLKEITDRIEAGIRDIFESGDMEKYRDYLRTMSRFHNYSLNNQALIHLQRPDATLVAGYNRWRDKFSRHVLRGEKGITIIAPTPYKKKIEQEKLDPDTKLPILDADGKIVTEEKEIEIPMFRPVKVFDYAQTDGKPLPERVASPVANLTGSVENYGAFMEALRRSSPVPVEFKPLSADMDGYFSPKSQSITLREGMSEVQTVSAAVHEIAHAKLHNYGLQQAAERKAKSRNTEEVEAESISFMVCAYFGIETGANSFGYVATWSKNAELPEFRASLDTISKTANAIITDVEKHFAEVCQERGIELPKDTEYELVTIPPSRADALAFAADYAAFLRRDLNVPDSADRPTAEAVADRLLAGEDAELRKELEDFVKLADEIGIDDGSHRLLERFNGLFRREWRAKEEPQPEIETETPNVEDELPPLPELEQGYPMPDTAVGFQEMYQYGYTDGNTMLPLTKERAMELFLQDVPVFLLYGDNTEAMALDVEDISSHTGVFGVEREEWDAVRGVVTLREQADTEKLFLENPQDAFLIYQIRRGGELDAYRFMNYDYLQSKGVTPERGGYDAIYTGGFMDYGNARTNLDMIYQRFNVDHPADFKGHSLSVSDIVALKQNGVVSCHYVDSIGFRELPNFLKPENYLKNVEMLLEDDYGMIDGIINNGPKQPTVADLEAQVKAGFSISLTELAAASHREQKKPSVLEKLRERTPEQAKNKTAPKRSAEREL